MKLNKKYKYVAPDVDRLLNCFDRNFLNSSPLSEKLIPIMESLYKVMEPIKPFDKDGEIKGIWILVPRGDISDYDSFDDMKEWGEVETYEEYIEYWESEYPNEYSWYKLMISECYEKDETMRYRGVSLGDKMLISANMKETTDKVHYLDDYLIMLCKLIIKGAKQSIKIIILKRE